MHPFCGPQRRCFAGCTGGMLLDSGCRRVELAHLLQERRGGRDTSAVVLSGLECAKHMSKQLQQQRLYACAGSAWLCAGRGYIWCDVQKQSNQAVGLSPLTPHCSSLAWWRRDQGSCVCVWCDVCISDIWNTPARCVLGHTPCGWGRGLACLASCACGAFVLCVA